MNYLQMDKNEIYQIIINIMINKLNINVNNLVEENYDKPLTGKVFKFESSDLTYLFFEIEKHFQIKIMPIEILHKEFNTIYGISEVVIKSIQRKEVKE